MKEILVGLFMVVAGFVIAGFGWIVQDIWNRLVASGWASKKLGATFLGTIFRPESQAPNWLLLKAGIVFLAIVWIFPGCCIIFAGVARLILAR